MKKFVLLLFAVLLSAMLFCSCQSAPPQDITGTWLLTGLVSQQTDEEVAFDEDVYIFNANHTGIELYLPGSYYEELSYITWQFAPNDTDVINIKHSEDYIYDIVLIDLSDDVMVCSYYKGDEVDYPYTATYERVSDYMSPFIGCWYLYEKYNNDDYISIENEYIYFYPSSELLLQYWEQEKEYTLDGSWRAGADDMALIISDGFNGETEYIMAYFINGNCLEMYMTAENGDEISYIYKRDYGYITNNPPVTYSDSFFTAFYRYISGIFNNLFDDMKS